MDEKNFMFKEFNSLITNNALTSFHHCYIDSVTLSTYSDVDRNNSSRHGTACNVMMQNE